jgi:hypothetical protein
MVFRDLAAVHGVDVEWLKQFYTDGDYFAWDWNHDPLTMGSRFLLPIVVADFLNYWFRCICVLWSGCIRQHRYLQPNASACCSWQTLLRW